MIHLLISLIMLPFTLLGVGIRLLFGVLGISTHVLLWPLKIFARHTVLCLVVAGVLILYLALKKDPHSLDTLKPAPKVEQTVKTPKGVAPIIERVEKEEDGDSAFATDTYAMMSEPERAAYSNVGGGGFARVARQIRRVLWYGNGVQIRQHKQAFMAILQPHPIADGPQVIAKVKVTRGLNAR
jgi:hypothetical protein